MAAIFITANRFLKLAYSPQGQKYNKEYFLNEKLKGINQERNHDTGNRVTKVMTIHMDNCRGHDAWKHYRQLAE
jgi:ATP-dependent Lon protease